LTTPSEVGEPPVELALEDHLGFEMLLSDLAARLIDIAPEDFERTVTESLQRLGAFLRSERGGIGLFAEDGSLRFQYGYFTPGAPTLYFGEDFARILPWYAAELRAGRLVIVRRSADELPPEAVAERAAVAALGLRSTIAVPLTAGGRVLGILGADHYARHCDWPADMLSRMVVLASVYANALHRRWARAALERAEALNRSILAALPSEIVVLDRAGTILTGNTAWQRSARRVHMPPDLAAVRDYLELARVAQQRGIIDGAEALSGVRAVLAGERRDLRARYAYVPPAGEHRHYLVTLSPRTSGDGFVVVHSDVTDLERTRADLESSLREQRELEERLEAENVVLRQEVRHGFDEIVGTSPALGRVLAQVRQVAPTDAPVLLLGETGTVKELVARAIHDRSRRQGRPLVTVNCAAMPATLIESELFGYEKGAFTGALQRTAGRFELANGGTLFLDEIGELPLELQPKLLRVLQSGEFERLGSSRTLRGDVRVIAATNRDLEREVREGRFRADLYYRLAVYPIALPPLRERREDVPLLVWHVIQRRQAKLGRSVRRVPERLMRAFAAYDWPGNVRELENVVERALITTNGDTLAADAALVAAPAAPGPTTGGGGTLAEAERAHILAVLDECGWKVTGRGNAAERLGMKRSTLQYRMRKLGIARPEAPR
jgi:transcriptional regulator with GAF, ATPase, and Fis domain